MNRQRQHLAGNLAMSVAARKWLPRFGCVPPHEFRGSGSSIRSCPFNNAGAPSLFQIDDAAHSHSPAIRHPSIQGHHSHAKNVLDRPVQARL